MKEASQKIIGQHLGPAVKDTFKEKKVPKASEIPGVPAKFPDYTEYVALDEQAETLPDIIHIPFEESVTDVALEGWEDLWFSNAELNTTKGGKLKEPKIDFVYTCRISFGLLEHWLTCKGVNGSELAFQQTIYPYEVNSTLNDAEGKWLESHRINRYRDWDELRYSIRSVEKYASKFRNKIQLLVNAIADPKDAPKATVENPQLLLGGRSRCG